MLTFILQAKDASLLVVDEPDIYLHSDLQRQLVNILKELGPNIILATHSTEIISEVDSDSLLNVNKRFNSARRIKNSRELQDVFSVLGSNLNPTLTQLAKTRRVIFVEGKDFQIFARFARKLGLNNVANRAHFAVVPVGGFNPQKVKDFAAGMELTLGTKLLKTVIFDRDYRSTKEAQHLTTELQRFCWHAVVHDRKEIENFLLLPSAITRALNRRLAENKVEKKVNETDIMILLNDLTESLKNDVQSHLVTSRQQFERMHQPGLHSSNVSKAAMDDFDAAWNSFDERIKLVPGKETLSLLNGYFQAEYKCALTPGSIVESFQRSDVCAEITDLLKKIDSMRNISVDE